MLIHFDFSNFIKIEIDALNFVIAIILFQLMTLAYDVEQT